MPNLFTQCDNGHMVTEMSDLEANGRITRHGMNRIGSIQLDNGTLVPWSEFQPQRDADQDIIHWQATVGNTVYVILND